jgi:integrase
VIELVASVADSGRRATARNLLAMLKALFSWAAMRGLIAEDSALPTDRIKATALLGQASSRDRVLSTHEVRLLWRVGERIADPYGNLLHLLMLWGTRLREAAYASHGEITVDDAGDSWLVVPGSRMKAGKTHRVFITPTALSIIERSPKRGQRGLILTEPSGRPIVAFSRVKTAIDRTAAEIAAADGIKGVGPWVLHDLRRTARSFWSAIPGVSDTAKEMALAHAPGGVRGIYDRHHYSAELKALALAWEAKLLQIGGVAGANVVPLPTPAVR